MPNKERHPVSTETNIEQEIKALNIAGLKTIFDVTAESPAQFIEQVVNAKGSVENAEILYQRAKDKVEEKMQKNAPNNYAMTQCCKVSLN